MRVSTNQIFRSGTESIQRTQQELSRTQTQLGSGKRMLSPADDPSGAVQALQFRSGIEKLDQYQRNGQMLEQRLRSSETVLTSVVDGLQRVRELALQGNNGTQTSETRGFIAGEIRQALDELYQLANSRDANGEYLFAGLRSLTQPFSLGAGGQVEYAGDAGQRELQISAVRTVALGDSGSRAFMDIPNGNGTYFVRDDPGNQGTGVIDAGSLVGPWVPGDYSVVFSEADGQLRYEVFGAGDPPASVAGPAAFQAGEAIAFVGAKVSIQGRPEPGDRFTVASSENQDLFATYRQLAEALEAPASDGASRASLNNAVNRALGDLDQGLGRLLEVRTSLGARLNTVETQNRINSEQSFQLQSSLSAVEDLDYAEAISRFNLQQTALQAAQQTFVQVQRLSLFNFL